MGGGRPNDPVVIDLDSDSDIEIIHHTFVIADDETPSKPGPSRRTTQQRGISSQTCSSTTKHSKFPGVKVEQPADPPESKPLTARSIISDDDTADDSACEVDDAYSHAEVLDEMPWLSESDIKDVPPTRNHLYHMAIHPEATKGIQQLQRSERHTNPWKSFLQPSPWFCFPDSLSLKLQGIAITGAKQNSNVACMGTPNWRRPHHTENSRCFHDWRGLQLIKSQRVAPGSVNQVAQSEGIFAVASSTIQGGDDSPPTVDNMGPSLLFWEDKSGLCPMYAHTKSYGTEIIPPEETRDEFIEGLKHFTVSDVKFHPQSPKQAVSCGYDKHVFFWTLETNHNQLCPQISGRIEMDRAPTELHYRGDNHGTLAIVADGCIHICRHSHGPSVISESGYQFEPARGCCVSGLEWGHNRTSDLLFVTWQPHGQKKFVNRHNFHQSLGAQDGKLVYNFSSSTDPGSALSLSPDGSRIALATHTGICHKLSIFDVRAGVSKLTMEHTISGIPSRNDIEHLKFDPSGEYLAIGRSDNMVQIFDTRMGAILHTLHHGKSISTKPHSEDYGITAMEWVTGWHGCGVRLLTGGEDGCVRMWDIAQPAVDYRMNNPLLDDRRDPANGHAIAREKDSIGHFTVGNKGIYDGHEAELVVGDESGYVSIYDRKGILCR